MFKKLTIAIIILAFTSCREEVKETNHSEIRNKLENEQNEIIKKQIQYQYESATFKNDSITYWWVLLEDSSGRVWSIIKQNHSYFSPTEAKNYILSKGYKEPYLINFVQVSEASYLSEGYK